MFTLSGPDDDGFVWLRYDEPEFGSSPRQVSVNLGKVEDVVEKFSDFLGQLDHQENG
jgi:hypothetical protein